MPGSGRYDAVLVPEKSIGTQQNERFMLVLDKDNVAQYRPVQLGSTHDHLRVVTAGLKADERFVVSALARVRPGTKVDPQMITIEPLSLSGHRRRLKAPPPQSIWPSPKTSPQVIRAPIQGDAAPKAGIGIAIAR